MSTVSDLNDYTSFLPGPLMPTLVHFQSVPQCGIFSKSKLIICLSAPCCSHLHSHLHSQTPDTAMAPRSSWDDVQSPNAAHKVLCGLLRPPLSSVLPTFLILLSLAPQGMSPRRFRAWNNFSLPFHPLDPCSGISDMAHTLTRSDPSWQDLIHHPGLPLHSAVRNAFLYPSVGCLLISFFLTVNSRRAGLSFLLTILLQAGRPVMPNRVPDTS